LVRSPLYTNDGETAANGPQKTQSDAPARYRERRWKKTKKRKKGMIKENTKEEQKKMIPATSNRPSGYSFGTALTATTRGEGAELAEFLSRLADSGVASPNECRSMIGLPAVADGDLLRAPSNTYALPLWANLGPDV